MDGLSKVSEELGRAVRNLAIGRGGIKSRLADAGIDIVAIRVADAEDFTERIKNLRGVLLRFGAVPDTVPKLTEDECVDAASEILALDYAVDEELNSRR